MWDGVKNRLLTQLLFACICNNGVFSVICSLLMLVPDASGDHMVETYTSVCLGLVMALYVASIVSFRSPPPCR